MVQHLILNQYLLRLCQSYTLQNYCYYYHVLFIIATKVKLNRLSTSKGPTGVLWSPSITKIVDFCTLCFVVHKFLCLTSIYYVCFDDILSSNDTKAILDKLSTKNDPTRGGGRMGAMGPKYDNKRRFLHISILKFII